MPRDSIAPEARAVEKRHALLPRAAACLAWARGRNLPVVFVRSRPGTTREVDHFRNGGLLHHVARHRLTSEVHS